MKLTKKEYIGKTYFIVSDLHSHLTPLKMRLESSIWQKDNPNDILVINGDIFDRGDETVALYKYLKTISQNRLILIRGNHDELLFNLLESADSYPEGWQFSNGTVKTICAMYSNDDVEAKKLNSDLYNLSLFNFDLFISLWMKIKKKALKSNIYKWMKSDGWINYLELGDFIITHSFIPVRIQEGLEDYTSSIIYYGKTNFMRQMRNWRSASDDIWRQSMWGVPYLQFDAGLFNFEKRKHKVLVVGHFKSSAFHEHYENAYNNDSIYFGDNLIAIDATTAISNKTNLLIIKDNKIIK